MKPSRKIERALDRLAIQNLTFYLVAGQGLALLLTLSMPGTASNMFLIPEAVMDGQWWRVLSFVFTPPFSNPLCAACALYLLFMMGGSLEHRWGTLRYNAFVLIGYAMTIFAAFAFPFGPATNAYITGSIFLAFAYLFPDFELLLFFVLPVKVKWLAWITWAGYALSLAIGDNQTRLLVLAATANFLLFFGRDLFHRARYGHRKMQKQSAALRTRDQPTHVCTTCGVTDKTDRTMDFRYCTKCSPPLPYCMNHLTSHEHVNRGG
jgi:hypothetical protein